jgi:predicted nucleic acid-binding protein
MTLLSELASARVAAPATAPESITGDPDDDLILACSIDAGVQIVVSGDRKHLLPVGEYSGVPIVTPQTLLAELANE